MVLGTTLVGLRTPEAFILASDGQATFRGGKTEEIKAVRKIFETNGIVYGMAGLVKDSARGFDPERLIEQAARQYQPSVKLLPQLQLALQNHFLQELTRLFLEEPDFLKKIIAADQCSLSVLLCQWHKEPIAQAIHFQGWFDADNSIQISTKTLSCPGDCPNGIFRFLLGKCENIKIAPPTPHLNLEEVARYYIELEIQAGTPGIGGPINLIKMDETGIKWL